MLIPIGTEVQTRHAPVANYAIIGANVAVFLLTDFLGGDIGLRLKADYALDAARPAIYQYITYQFLHGDLLHLAGNMLFLWIFGNAVCDRMGTIAYVMFYVAGGIFAGYVFARGADNPMVGASGAIAAITTAFLALYPRVHITMLVWMFFIFTFQLPAMILIVFKIILWDNIVAPGLSNQAVYSNVAYSAHLGGYAFGFAVSMLLLGIRALPRNQFDMVALWQQWRRRHGLVTSGGTPRARAIARPVRVEQLESRPLGDVPLTPIERLREEIANHFAKRDLAEAAAAYRRLLAMDANQVLARPQQLEIGNFLAQNRDYSAAVRAYEAFLTAYPGAADAPQVLLFVGMIYSRYLHDPERAARHLRRAIETVPSEEQRRIAENELREVESRLLGPEDSPEP